MPLCRIRACASPAAVERFLSEADEGALRPLVGTYRLVGPGSASQTFVYTTQPSGAVLSYFPPPSDYLYETVADGLKYEFIANRSGYFECLTRVAKPDWGCRGPISASEGGVGGSATVGSYDVEPDLADYLGPPGGPAPLTTREMNGFRLTCITYTQKVKIPLQTWCVTQGGVLAYVSAPSFSRRIELVHLSLGVPQGEFSLPSRPKAWHGFEDQEVQAFAPPGFANSATG